MILPRQAAKQEKRHRFPEGINVKLTLTYFKFVKVGEGVTFVWYLE